MKPLLVSIMALATSVSLAHAGGGGCAGDVNSDGVVDVGDITALIIAWDSADPAADINDDGTVNVQDLTALIIDWGCEVFQGPTSQLSGTVTNMITGAPVEGAMVSVGGEVLITGQDGDYSGDFPVGQYAVTFEAEHFNGTEDSIVIFPGFPAVLDAVLEPVAPVVVEVVIMGDATPGANVMAMADVTILDGSMLNGFQWMQLTGAEAGLMGTDTDTVSVDLGDAADYKAELRHVLAEPPVGPEDLPDNVIIPPGEFPAGLQNRFQVVGLNPFALEETVLVTLGVEVTTTSGMYEAEGEIHTELAWKPAAGIRNVPVGIPVVLHGKDQMAYDWSMMRPDNSSAILLDAATQNPEFVPDVAGVYELTVTDEATGDPVTMEVFAGNWRGIIVGQDVEGNPISDPSCTGCHSNLGYDLFTPWAQTGHAHIFSDNLNDNTHWGPQCFSCHSVGYDPAVNNNGIDEQADYQDFLNSGLINNPGNNWSVVLEEYPDTAFLANVQCENCHGPQWGLAGMGSQAHGPVQPEGEPRVSLSADVCATCHGEPLRHARYQQWQLSAHANYELAIDESESGNCSRCHTGNGFLAWLPVLMGDEPGDPLDNIEVTWAVDETHPQTCVTCHDPHSIGTTSGIDTNATVRISGHTPPLIAGFTAYGVGRGAICMTCHNSRRGLRNDETFPDFEGTSEAARAPHGSAQTDLIMGENAYLVQVGIRGNHSFLTDVCVACHMEETPPPDVLSYNQGGTNHTFFAADTICQNCHTGIDAEFIQGGVQDTLLLLQGAMEEGIIDLIGELTGQGNAIDLDGEVTITDVAEIDEVFFGEFRGRQAITVLLSDDSQIGPLRMTDIDVLNPSMMVIGQLYDFADAGLVKAGWNYNLVNNDGSFGVHNPTFAFTALSAALEATNPALAATLEWPEWLDHQQVKAQLQE